MFRQFFPWLWCLPGKIVIIYWCSARQGCFYFMFLVWEKMFRFLEERHVVKYNRILCKFSQFFCIIHSFFVGVVVGDDKLFSLTDKTEDQCLSLIFNSPFFLWLLMDVIYRVCFLLCSLHFQFTACVTYHG